MRTPEWESVKLGRIKGFNLFLSFEQDHQDPEDHFKSVCGWDDEQYKEIKNYFFFTAKVEAYKGKILASEVYLGACCHQSKKDVLASELGGYLPQMIDEAIQDAIHNLEIED